VFTVAAPGPDPNPNPILQLRGEEGIFYVDLYHLVKYLPSYALPAGLPSVADLHSHSHHNDGFGAVPRSPTVQRRPSRPSDVSGVRPAHRKLESISSRNEELPFPATAGPRSEKEKKAHPQTLVLPADAADKEHLSSPGGPRRSIGGRLSLGGPVEDYLLPARSPPKYSYFDLFPFSLLVHFLTKRGKEVSGAKAARLRSRIRTAAVSHNLPHEISLYLSSYVAALQARKAIDPPTTSECRMFVASASRADSVVTCSNAPRDDHAARRRAHGPRAHPDDAHSVFILDPPLVRYARVSFRAGTLCASHSAQYC
jgi:putative membrane protein